MSAPRSDWMQRMRGFLRSVFKFWYLWVQEATVWGQSLDTRLHTFTGWPWAIP